MWIKWEVGGWSGEMKPDQNAPYVCSYGHFVNCFEFVFVGLFCLFFCSLVIWQLSIFSDVFGLIFFVCISIIDFCFAVTMRFLYNNLYISICYCSITYIYQGSPKKVKVAQSCPTICDPVDYTESCEILQARILEWVVRPFSRGSSQPRDQTQVSLIAGRFFTSWATREAPKLLIS